jgi:hypothetical protein
VAAIAVPQPTARRGPWPSRPAVRLMIMVHPAKLAFGDHRDVVIVPATLCFPEGELAVPACRGKLRSPRCWPGAHGAVPERVHTLVEVRPLQHLASSTEDPRLPGRGSDIGQPWLPMIRLWHRLRLWGNNGKMLPAAYMAVHQSGDGRCGDSQAGQGRLSRGSAARAVSAFASC